MTTTAPRSTRLLDVVERPLVSVFLPDRLELVKGATGAAPRPPGPVGRRPVARSRGDPPCYAQTLAQRNALLARIRAGRAAPDSLEAWDAELARSGMALWATRAVPSS